MNFTENGTTLSIQNQNKCNTYIVTDSYTKKLQMACDHYEVIFGLSNMQAAQIIRKLGVHILFDLSGHTAYNRLPLFALKPAPVQASWLGYFASTGVPGMDYLLVDKEGALPEYQRECTEKLIYLPLTRLCFTPPDKAPDIIEGYAGKYPVYGSFAQLSKITDEVLALWSEILDRNPDAKLRIQTRALGDGDFIKRSGIPEDRLMMHGMSSYSDYLKAYQEIDLILDTFPYPGGTTTCEALWMGVPTLTMAGKTLISRQGASIMSAVGYPEWIANTREDYIQKALNIKPKKNIRPALLNTPLFNAQMFARDFEMVLDKMWRMNMPMITIDGKEYDTEQLSDEAKQQLGSIQFIDRKVQELQAEISVYQTARNGYARALSEILDKQ